MVFRKINSIDPVVEHLSALLGEKLNNGQRVFWLVTGGSSIKIAAAVSHHLKNVNLSGLTITLTDERYGDIGHSDSNWLQLEAAGFSLPGAILHPVLVGKSIEQTTIEYDTLLNEQLASGSFRLGLFGMGPDGHVAGILPHSSAIEDSSLASYYDGGQYQRITMTPSAIKQLDEAVLYAVGQDKWPVIDKLEVSTLVQEQPAQALKQVARLTVYNDHKGEEI